jgi:hypothetical protein
MCESLNVGGLMLITSFDHATSSSSTVTKTEYRTGSLWIEYVPIQWAGEHAALDDGPD